LEARTVARYVLSLCDRPLADASSLEIDEKVVETFARTGASIAKKLKKNKHQKEEERREMDRVLGPAPILDE